MMNREQRRLERKAQRKPTRPIVSRAVWSKVDPIKHAIEGACVTSEAKRNKLLMTELMSIEAFTKGCAGLQEWYDLVAACNIAQILAEQGVGKDAMPDLLKAEQALIDAASRLEKTGKLGLTGPGIQALREMVEWHDAQRAAIPLSQYEAAIKTTKARIESGHKVINLNKMFGK